MLKYIKQVLSEFNDSPLDFIKSAIVVLAIVGVWGLIMGLMEEYR